MPSLDQGTGAGQQLVVFKSWLLTVCVLFLYAGRHQLGFITQCDGAEATSRLGWKQLGFTRNVNRKREIWFPSWRELASHISDTKVRHIQHKTTKTLHN